MEKTNNTNEPMKMNISTKIFMFSSSRQNPFFAASCYLAKQSEMISLEHNIMLK